MLIQLKIMNAGLGHAAGRLAAAVLCGAIVAGCSGTIDTPTEDNPPRRTERAATQGEAASGSTNQQTPSQMAPTEDEEEEDTASPDPAPTASSETDTGAESELPPVDEEEEEAPVAPPPGDLSFEADIWPIFTAQCEPCHSTLGLGGQNIGSDSVREAFDDAVDGEDGVLRDLADGRMPPACAGGEPGAAGCVSAEELAMIEAWYEDGAAE